MDTVDKILALINDYDQFFYLLRTKQTDQFPKKREQERNK